MLPPFLFSRFLRRGKGKGDGGVGSTNRVGARVQLIEEALVPGIHAIAEDILYEGQQAAFPFFLSLSLILLLPFPYALVLRQREPQPLDQRLGLQRVHERRPATRGGGGGGRVRGAPGRTLRRRGVCCAHEGDQEGLHGLEELGANMLALGRYLHVGNRR